MATVKVLYAKGYTIMVAVIFVIQYAGIIPAFYATKDIALLVYIGLVTAGLIYIIPNYFKKVIRGVSAIEINAEGIVDGLFKQPYTIYWTDIRGFSTVGLFKGSGVIVYLDDPREYRRRGLSGYIAYYTRMMHFGSPVIIQTPQLNISRKALYKVLEEYLERYKTEHGL